MRKTSFVCFDEFVPDTTILFTSQEFNAKLAQYDVIAIHGVVTNNGTSFSGSTKLTCFLEHSGDARSWIKKSATAEINQVVLNTSGYEGQAWGGDAGTMPTSAFARIGVKLEGTNGQVRITVTLRDTGA